ncbi:FAD dependent oxidoreductase [Microdochium trichocladiopsis]|uniref:FAD dependent oxidoreductase n=1 Tax=Microdochium trichocladiopsis TaxID=1682393 RepID=A0A9P9BPT6_9PEZI|nr:FAD dependent oxidoreductase [Microdochium trichocladiopsis]KAH7033459.1 FAD dependent oxidoreductase [Microdochium trichocladiopsis]
MAEASVEPPSPPTQGSARSQKTDRNDPILIVGAGVFGLSLAHELVARRGYTDVTVLDRALPPVPDGSSVDVSRIVRSEYADPVYTRMAKEAIVQWRRGGDGGDDEGGYAPWYDESGFVIIAEGDHHPYTAKALEEGRKNTVVVAAEAAAGKNGSETTTASSRAEGFTAAEAGARITEMYPAVQAHMQGYSAVHNPDGGWADAAGAIGELARRASRAGVNFVTGRRGTVVRLKYAPSSSDAYATAPASSSTATSTGGDDCKVEGNRKAIGVETLAGETMLASRVVLAAGAWTNNLLPGVEHAFLATGQPVAFVQLTQAEADTLRPRHPVIVNLSTGVFCFPPTPGPGGNVLKVARHGYGFATSVRPGHSQEDHLQIQRQHEPEQDPQKQQGGGGAGGTERTISSPARDADNSASGYLPDDADAALREGFRQFFPQFADRPWSKRRMCWYTDTAKGDFVVDNHPSVEGVFFATGGSGHGFKFLPVLGRYLADCFEDKASPEIREKWRLPTPPEGETVTALSMIGDGSRAGPPLRRLTEAEQAKL